VLWRRGGRQGNKHMGVSSRAGERPHRLDMMQCTRVCNAELDFCPMSRHWLPKLANCPVMFHRKKQCEEKLTLKVRGGEGGGIKSVT
jgi:hypothetical protein